MVDVTVVQTHIQSLSGNRSGAVGLQKALSAYNFHILHAEAMERRIQELLNGKKSPKNMEKKARIAQERFLATLDTPGVEHRARSVGVDIDAYGGTEQEYRRTLIEAICERLGY